jgi:hypothetical protein
MVLTWVTTQGPASITVQGIFFPFSSKILVMPIFLPINPDINMLLIIKYKNRTHHLFELIFKNGAKYNLFTQSKNFLKQCSFTLVNP